MAADPRTAIFKSLSDPTRRAIFERLCREGERPVAVLTAGAGVSQPVVSKHLAVLKGAGLVSVRQAGRQSWYRAEPGALAPMVDWTREMAAFWDDRLDALGTLLNRMDQ
ncbi:metalloregulator ArsR/SmtB family transcription factor [Rhodobacterales bacterium HKCCE2091]|nr:metalloregulator ArsR/SmtB family transcription factor [Rhodobacterales bacterium HKCCE2091]